jgi:hypothetical protein
MNAVAVFDAIGTSPALIANFTTPLILDDLIPAYGSPLTGSARINTLYRCFLI